MSEAEFIGRLRALSRDCRELVSRPGDPGPVPVTKLGGEPWWPKGTPRPICRRGSHRMAFIAQVLLGDVPGLKRYDSHLYSFHYCQRCAHAGEMSFGWSRPDHTPEPVPFPTLLQRALARVGVSPLPTIPQYRDPLGYDTSIFTSVHGARADGLGVLAESAVAPQRLSGKRVGERPEPDDYPEGLDDPRDPLSTLSEEDRIFEDAGLPHVRGSKLGGWPSWAQSRQYPPGPKGESMRFIGQIDDVLAPDCAWGGGGYAYLFADLSQPESPAAQLVIQVT